MRALMLRFLPALLATAFAGLVAAHAADAVSTDQPDRGLTRVIGGRKAPDGAWPSQVKIYVPDPAGRGRLVAHCGGTAVSSEWILTAAHCIIAAGTPGARQPAIAPQELIVVTGVARVPAILTQDDPIMRHAIKVKSVVTHPEFNPDTFSNDIALLKLEKPAGVPAMPLTGPLDRDSDFAGLAATVVGWGFTQYDGNTDTSLLPADLQEVELPIVDIATCAAAYQASALKTNSIDARNICAGFKSGGRDACRGDSGGPLMVRSETGDWVQAGVVSWGEGCGRKNRYGVYTRVAAFEAWLREVTSDQLARPLRPSPEARFTGDEPEVADLSAEPATDATQPLFQLTSPADITRMATALAPGDRALIIGIDGYAAPLTLSGSVTDAAAMADLAVTELGFRRDQVLILTNEKATRANIQAAFDAWLIQGTQSGSRVLLFYSGQGFQSRVFPSLRDTPSGPAIVPVDLALVPDQDGRIRDVSNAIPPSELATLLNRLKSRTVTALFDTTQITRRGLQRPAHASAEEIGSVRSVEAAVDIATGLIDLDLRPAVPAFAPSPNAVVWLGSGLDQWALVDRRAAAPMGAFTRQFIDGVRARRLMTGQSNRSLADLGKDIAGGTARFCDEAGRLCRLGLNPELIATPDVLDKPVQLASHAVGVAARALPMTQNTAGVTIEANAGHGLDIKQSLTISTKKPGYLLVLRIGSDGRLSQIYPDIARLTAPDPAVKSPGKRNLKDINAIQPGRPVVLPAGSIRSVDTDTGIVVAVEADKPVEAIDLPDRPLNAHDAASGLVFVSDFLKGLKAPDENGRLQDLDWSFDAKPLAGG